MNFAENAVQYGWWILALVLIAAEMILPGYFLLWIGIAAALMGVLTFVLPSLGMLGQAIVFGVLAVATCAIYWRFIRPLAEQRNDQPLLNRLGQRFVGRRFTLVEPIVNGRGRIPVGDGWWLAEGPDLPAGSEVEVVAVHGATLMVRPLA
jgi:membrane protein implicated in regulation of membrane protease activity